MWLDKLRIMKKQSRLTTKEISSKSGLPEPTLEKLFAGATKDPKLNTIQQLVHFLGYTLDDLDEVPKNGNQLKVQSPAEKNLLGNYRVLNEEGQEKLVDYADDLVSSGKYKKHDQDFLGEKEA